MIKLFYSHCPICGRKNKQFIGNINFCVECISEDHHYLLSVPSMEIYSYEIFLFKNVEICNYLNDFFYSIDNGGFIDLKSIFIYKPGIEKIIELLT